MKNYGDNLKIIRKQHNLSLLQLEKLTGISNQNLSRWERNEVIPNIEFCEILANFYDISIDELIGRDYEKASKIKNAVTYQNSVHNGDNKF